MGEAESAVGWWSVDDGTWEHSVNAERAKNSSDGAVLYGVGLSKG